MTPTILLSILVALSLVLAWLLFGVARELRSRREPKRKPVTQSRESRIRKLRSLFQRPVAAAEEVRPEPVERRRRLSPSEGIPASAHEPVNETFHASVTRRLEQAFALYEQRRISIATYETMIEAERLAIGRKRTSLRASELGGSISDEQLDRETSELDQCEKAVAWCLDWASTQRLEAGRPLSAAN